MPPGNASKESSSAKAKTEEASVAELDAAKAEQDKKIEELSLMVKERDEKIEELRALLEDLSAGYELLPHVP